MNDERFNAELRETGDGRFELIVNGEPRGLYIVLEEDLGGPTKPVITDHQLAFVAVEGDHELVIVAHERGVSRSDRLQEVWGLCLDDGVIRFYTVGPNDAVLYCYFEDPSEKWNPEFIVNYVDPDDDQTQWHIHGHRV